MQPFSSTNQRVDTGPRESSTLETTVLARTPSGAFRLVGAPPAWLLRFIGTAPGTEADLDLAAASPFLDNFLIDAETFWARRHEGQLSSGPWTEVAPDGVEWTLEATALWLHQQALLLLHAPRFDLSVAQRLLQQGREQRLDYERLRREIEKREILLHCIVHDLSNPLASIIGCLHLLEARQLVDAKGQRLLEISTEQAERMQALTKAILDTFAADVASLLPSSLTPESAPDVVAVARTVLEAVEAQATLRRIRLALHAPPTAQAVCDTARLERVLHNLVGNALQHVPDGGFVQIEILREQDELVLHVDDNGPGVPEALVPYLFHRFVRGPESKGQAGLGLYFCHMTVSGWGGTLTYTPRPEGGARFTLHLRSFRP